MNVIDEIMATHIDESDIGTLIMLDNEPVEIRAVLESEDINGVSLQGYSLVSGMVETHTLQYDQMVPILGE